MKLIVVTPYFYPKIGGMENYAYNICKELIKKYNWEVIVITSNHEKDGAKSTVLAGIKIYKLQYFFKISNTPINPFWLYNIRKILNKELPDIINVHSPVPFISDTASFVSGKIPVVTTYHSGSMIKPRSIFNPFIYIYELLFLPVLFKKSIKIICTSALFVRQIMKKYGTKIKYIPPGVDITIFRPSRKKPKNEVLYVGRIEKNSDWKGINYLLDAIAIVKKIKPDISLRLIGSGDRIEYFKNYAQKLEINENIVFVGEKINDALALEYQLSKMIVLPSVTESESFGIVLIEAMACKKPVIGSNIGGIPFVIDNEINGLLVPPKDPEALAGAIIKILGDTDLAEKMGEEGYKKIIENFTWDRQVKKIKNIIEECVSK